MMAKKQITLVKDDPTVYRFCGNGMGIPGLPHEVTPERAKQMDMLNVLEGAILNGSYKAVKQTNISATHVSEIAAGGLEPPRRKGA
jgi:hypothetical protein